MPALTTGSIPAVNDLAAEIARQLSATGNAARATVGDRAQAFSWTGGIRPWAGSVFASTLVDGMQWRATRVQLTATPPKKVAKGAVKPIAVQMLTVTRPLAKYAGIGELTLEDILDTDAIVSAIYAVLFDGCLQAFDADIGAALTADAGNAASGANWSAAILAGIAEVPSADVLVMAPADYAAAAAPSDGFTMSGADAIPVVHGLMVVLCAMPPGTAFVCNRNALMVADSRLSPLVIADPYSKADTNTTRLVADLVADAYVTAPGAVCAVTVGP